MKLYRFLKGIFLRFRSFKYLQKLEWRIKFKYEGNQTIFLPPIKFWEIYFQGKYLDNCYEFSQRPNKEVLLRHLVNTLFEMSYLSREISIIDIGSWISDNSLVWSKKLDTKNGFVYAIDPSSKNHDFAKILAKNNNINNIKFVQAVCSDFDNTPLGFHGKITHARFEEDNAFNDEHTFLSSTLDSIINKELKTKTDIVIGFLHIDVEGFELKVMRGAKDLIERDRPLITFEQHISNENVFDVVEFLKIYDYQVYMINESIPGNRLDCRNFIAFDSRKEIPHLKNICELLDNEFYKATIGEALIRLN